MVIFGAAGDLTKRKLIPALYNLKHSKLLSDQFAVLGIARAEMSDEEFRAHLRDDMKSLRATESIRKSGNGSRIGFITCREISTMTRCTHG